MSNKTEDISAQHDPMVVVAVSDSCSPVTESRCLLPEFWRCPVRLRSSKFIHAVFRTVQQQSYSQPQR